MIHAHAGVAAPQGSGPVPRGPDSQTDEDHTAAPEQGSRLGRQYYYTETAGRDGSPGRGERS